MAQMTVSKDKDENLRKSVRMIEWAKESDLILFPEIQMTPFFPQYRRSELEEKLGMGVDDLVTTADGGVVPRLRKAASDNSIYVSPNLYFRQEDGSYDTSLLIDRWGFVIGDTEMVHVTNAPLFYEKDYYTPSKEGFDVFDTDFGKVAIVICYDRHFPESIRTCALRGAELILIPTANGKHEPMDVFEAELRAAAFDNNVFIAMCNRVGKEDQIDFAGESLVIDCHGAVIAKANDREELVTTEIDLSEASKARRDFPYLSLRRPEMYER